jgi:hypothetical protein
MLLLVSVGQENERNFEGPTRLVQEQSRKRRNGAALGQSTAISGSY